MVYIGQAFNISKRWKNHKLELNLNRHCNPYLQSAWNKHGSFNFEFSVLEYCEKDKLTEREQFWMDTYKSYNRILGYNLQSVAGGSMLGFKASEETKALLSEMRSGKELHNDESKAKISKALKGRVFSEETLKKMSESHIGNKHNESFKDKMSVRLTGNSYAKGVKRSPEHLAAMFAGRMKKKKRS